MSVTVKFFASLRERLGREEVRVELGAQRTVRDVWRQATADAALPDNIIMSVNMEYAPPDAPVKDGDEVAFFPPITGGRA